MRAVLLLLALGFGLAQPLRAQAQPGMTRALDLERRGDYAAAIQAYLNLLKARPADLSAMLGLERSLLPLNRSAEMLPVIRAALAAAPTSSAVHGIALRTWAALGQPDSVRRVAQQWARIAPAEETPYREWGAAELARQNRAGARTAYLQGRAHLGRPDALSAELAQLALSEGDYASALREWLLASRKLPGYRATAVAALSQAPEAARPELLRILASNADPSARRLEAELRARWGDPAGALRVVMAALPPDRVQAIIMLRALLDQVRLMQTPEALQVQGQILEAVAERSPQLQASRLRLEAAQAYASAGDKAGARRMLGGLAADRSAPASVSSDAATTLVGVLIDEGKLDEAEQRLRTLKRDVSADEFDSMRRKLVIARIRSGDLERADSMIAADSSIEGLALSGRVRLYRGDIRGAVERFKAAGPYSGDRIEATRRTALLALLQPLEVDTQPALGRALFRLEQGDTAAAVQALEQLASEFPSQHGGAEIGLLAGRLLAGSGKAAEAERLFRSAASRDAPATAPAAELALAELLLSQGRPGEAVQVLEHLILTYPQSALVPQARRKLDEARGAVPRT
ncbi:MAG TPA: tetratricopeptide repeat protein [Gemmatimonadales bacterium]|nr:tetratricopeptide repeat protein [Gemmatimonadales bacterium]